MSAGQYQEMPYNPQMQGGYDMGAQPYPAAPYPPYAADYEYRDITEVYGSIIKELTETEEMLRKFELRLRGKTLDSNNKVVKDESETPYMTDDATAREFINIIRSIVNRHTDFSYYEEDNVYQILDGANKTLNRWLMLQSKKVPTRYRAKISFEAMSYISASLHKAMNGRMLSWTKGSFSEGRSGVPQEDSPSLWSYIFPFGKNKRR